MNQMTISGRLVRDPEIFHTHSDKRFTRFRVAINEYHTDKDGERVKNTVFMPVVAWDKMADNVEKYLRQGSWCIVTGKMDIGNYVTAKEEQKNYFRLQAARIEWDNSRTGSSGDEFGNDEIKTKTIDVDDGFSENEVPF